MSSGHTLVLLDHDNIYESLYDVLNQRYTLRSGGTETIPQRFLRLAVGKRSQLVPVHSDFRLIAVTSQSHAYANLDLPLLNRFEKQVLLLNPLLGFTGGLETATPLPPPLIPKTNLHHHSNHVVL